MRATYGSSLYVLQKLRCMQNDTLWGHSQTISIRSRYITDITSPVSGKDRHEVWRWTSHPMPFKTRGEGKNLPQAGETANAFAATLPQQIHFRFEMVHRRQGTHRMYH